MSLTASKNLWNLVESGENSDCTIIVNDGHNPIQKFKLHRVIIKKFSPVLRAMLESGMKEDKTGIIEIIDFPPQVVKRVLRHIYCCKLEKDLTLQDIIDLLIVADKYQIKTLIEDCNEYIIEKFLDIEKCAVLLANIHLFPSSSNVKELCFGILQENTKELFCDNSLLKISEQTLQEILKLEEFNLDGELDLVNFAERWALDKIENNAPFKSMPIRKVLGNKILSNLRLLTLSVEEIKTKICLFILLTKEERQLLTDVLLSGKIKEDFPSHFSKSKVKRFFNGSKLNVKNRYKIF